MEPSTFAMFGTPKACKSPRLPPRRSYGSPCLATVMHRRRKIESYSHTIMFFHWSKCIHISNTFAHTYIYIILSFIFIFMYLVICFHVIMFFLKKKLFIYIHIYLYIFIHTYVFIFTYLLDLCLYVYIYMCNNSVFW
jgi:hypothetical protein